MGTASKRFGGEADAEIAALRSELAGARAELLQTQHQLLTLRDHVIGTEAELDQLRNHGGPPLESKEMQAALFLVSAIKALRLGALVRLGPVKRLARYLLGVLRTRER